MANIATTADISAVRLHEQANDPTNPLVGFSVIYAKNGGLYLKSANGTVTGPFGPTVTPTPPAIYPTNQLIWGPQMFEIVGNSAINYVPDTTMMGCMLCSFATPANGLAMEVAVLLKAGVYTFMAFGKKTNNSGRVDYSLDGSNFLTAQDWYSSTAVPNFSVSGTMTVSASGRHLVRFTVNGKSGSSSGYQHNFLALFMAIAPQTSEV